MTKPTIIIPELSGLNQSHRIATLIEVLVDGEAERRSPTRSKDQ